MRKTIGIAAALLAMVWTGTAMGEEIRPGVYRTPDERFENLPDFPFAPHYKEIEGFRVHYLDEGPADGDVILLLHGEPTWSYLYRHMVPVLVKAGHRCIVPDLIGFGKSDKPASMDVHTFKFHVDTMTELVKALDLEGVTFVGQDWGGLIGLRVVAENPDRFARVVVANTGLPVGTGQPPSPGFAAWRAMNQRMVDAGDMDVGGLIAGAEKMPELAGPYNAPYPAPEYKAGALIMPQRVPVEADDPANEANLAAWEVFSNWEKPFLTCFSDGDPITRGGDQIFQARVPGAKGQPHTTIKGGGHFLQETHGEEWATVINGFIASTK